MPDITNIWILFNIPKLWGYRVYYCKNVNGSSDWMVEVCHHICFQQLTPRGPHILVCLCLFCSLAGWHLAVLKADGIEGVIERILPQNGTEWASSYSPRTWPGHTLWKSQRYSTIQRDKHFKSVQKQQSVPLGPETFRIKEPLEVLLAYESNKLELLIIQCNGSSTPWRNTHCLF